MSNNNGYKPTFYNNLNHIPIQNQVPKNPQPVAYQPTFYNNMNIIPQQPQQQPQQQPPQQYGQPQAPIQKPIAKPIPQQQPQSPMQKPIAKPIPQQQPQSSLQKPIAKPIPQQQPQPHQQQQTPSYINASLPPPIATTQASPNRPVSFIQPQQPQSPIQKPIAKPIPQQSQPQYQQQPPQQQFNTPIKRSTSVQQLTTSPQQYQQQGTSFVNAPLPPPITSTTQASPNRPVSIIQNTPPSYKPQPNMSPIKRSASVQQLTSPSPLQQSPHKPQPQPQQPQQQPINRSVSMQQLNSPQYNSTPTIKRNNDVPQSSPIYKSPQSPLYKQPPQQQIPKPQFNQTINNNLPTFSKPSSQQKPFVIDHNSNKKINIIPNVNSSNGSVNPNSKSVTPTLPPPIVSTTLSSTTWREKGILFGFPMLNNNDIKNSVMSLLSSNDGIETFTNSCLTLFNNRGLSIPELDQLSANAQYYNISTLLKQVYKSQPQKSDPFKLKLYDTLSLCVVEQKINYSDMIIDLEKQGDIEKVTLKNVIVTIEQRDKVSIERLNTFTFSSGLKYLKDVGQTFEIQFAQDIQSNCVLPIGYYKVGNIRRLKDLEIDIVGKDSMKFTVSLAIHDTTISNGNSSETMPNTAINSIYKIQVRESRQNITQITKSNIDSYISVTENQNEKQKTLHQMELLKQEKDKIRYLLIHSDYKDLLNLLLSELVKSKLQSIDYQVVKSSYSEMHNHYNQVFQQIVELVGNYQKCGVSMVTVDSFLRELVLESNYAKLIDKEQSIVIAKVMGILQKAYEEALKLQDKNTVFFIGNTGSGKSTVIAHLLGAKLTSSVNKLGHVTYSHGDTTDRYPVIGQSLTESETLISKGYTLGNGSDVVLCDCPGFKDSRGSTYELATNLSVDLSIQKCKSIRALVVVLPIQVFSTDRATPVIEMIETVRERFPKVFDPNNMDHSNNVYILISKGSQTTKEARKPFEEGASPNAFESFFKESIETYQKVLNKDPTKGHSNSELNEALRRRSIWNALVQLWKKKQIILLDMEDQFEKDKLLQRISKSPEMDKKYYEKSLKNGNLRKTLTDVLQISTHTFSELLFKRYISSIGDIQLLNKSIQEQHMKMDQIQETSSSKQNNELTLKENIKKYQDILTKISNHTINDDEMFTFNQQAKDQIMDIDQKLYQLEVTLYEGQQDQYAIEQQILSKSQILDGVFQQIHQIELEMDQFRNTQVVDTLFSYINGPDQTLQLFTLKSGANETNFEEMKNFTNEDVVEENIYNTSTYVGTVNITVIIEKEYRLVEKDKMKDIHQEKYAILQGRNFKICDNLGSKASPCGTKVIYSFDTIWSGNPDEIPWFSIEHIVPGQEYNYSMIQNLQSDLRGQKEQLSIESKALELLRKDLSGCKSTVTHAQQSLDILMNEKKQLLEQQQQDLYNQVTKSLEVDTQALERSKNDSRSNELVTSCLDRIQLLTSDKTQIQINKRNLAVIIYHQWETAYSLIEFTKILGGQEFNPFIHYFQQNLNTIVQELKNDLSIQNIPIRKIEIISTSQPINRPKLNQNAR
ncbi:myb domain-containing protein [Tieghemostelium lacteum]|uniref:Myb domain-containing protein n=1 Tax=Tieghemostelium lacteum TaxID=361077 RepID=A0A152AA09_TIELA|nr:myb domain-containing protein [Tieghemostelium lacteum]|eukprot:KYR03059.1 myb domain-containing protein [Tieghemostelium lacteum]